MSVTRNLHRAFGKYHIEQKIGIGGMAVVYRAYDPDTERRVALKVLHTFLVNDNNNLELRRRFRREAQIFVSLDHPNIVRILDHGEVDGTPYLVMEYMSRGSLAQRFEQPISVSLKTSALLLTQIAAGLDYAHAHGIIHRDLKLENILLDDYNRPALADFGIARVRDATRLTATRVIVGTPLTMSPEQALGQPGIDHRSDLYSLAVMAYLMATGYFPFTGEEALAILHKHLSATPPRPSEVNPELPKAIDVVLLKGLSKLPEERYQSAAEFASAFTDASTHVPIHTTSLIQVSVPNPVPPVITQTLTVHGDGIPTPNLNTVILPAPKHVRRWLSVVGIATFLLVVLFAILGSRPENPVVAQVPSATPTLFDPNGTVSFFMAQTIAAYTDTPTPTPTDSATDTPNPTITLSPTTTPTPTLTDTPTSTLTPSPTPFGDAVVIALVNVNVRRGPSADYPVQFGLAPGTRVQLIGRNLNASWLQISTQTSRKGWVAARLLQTSSDVLALPVVWVAAPATPTITPPAFVTSPTQTQPISSGGGGGGTSGGGGYVPTRVPTQPPHPTNTPSPIQILFYASPDHIDAGSCSTLSWSVSNADVVYLDGSLVGFSSNSTVCPNSDTTYTLSAQRNADGAHSEAYATVYVNAPPPSPSPESTQQVMADDAAG